MGGVLRTDFHGYKLTAGDDNISFALPTDVFTFGHYFYGRGVGVSRHYKGTKVTLFGGVTSDQIGASFFHVGRSNDAFGLLFMESKLAKNLNFVSRTVVTDKVTFLNGLEYTPKKWMDIGATAGLGAGKPYGALTMTLDRPKYLLKTGYILVDDKFRRISAETPLLGEVEKENILLLVRPSNWWSVSVARQNFLSPNTAFTTTSNVKAVSNQGSVAVKLFDFRLSGSVYRSESNGAVNLGQMYSADRKITSRVEAGVEYYRSKGDVARLAIESYTGRVRENITQRITLTQYVNRSQGQTTFNLGGEFNAPRFSIGVSHDTNYLPLRSPLAGGPFVRTYAVSLRIRPFGNLELTGQSVLSPDGRVRYTAAASDYLYRYAGLERGGLVQARMDKYVVKGVVVDENEQPVPGAALQIDGQMVFTDSDGRFMVRFPKRDPQVFKVLLDDFLTPRFYDVVSAPAKVIPAPEDSATDIVIRLRLVTDPARIKSRLTAAAQAQPATVPVTNP